MEKLKFIFMSVLVFGLVTCNGPNDKKGNDKTPTATDTREGDYGNSTSNTESDIDPASTSMDWGKDYDTRMDISPFYSNLDMTEQQIRDFESASNAYRENWSKKNGNNNVPVDDQAILVHRDSSLKSVLTEEQYKKYKEMAKERKNDNK